jgi:hypothetical protein
MRLLTTMLVILFAACGGDPQAGRSAPNVRGNDSNSQSARVLPREADAHGRTQVELAEDFQRFINSFPLADNPAVNPADTCGPGQTGPVYLLPPFGFTGLTERTCTVPHGTHVFFIFNGVLNDFPCPDPTFQPAPGQTLEDFLREGATGALSGIDLANFDVLVDGVSIPIEPHRITTPLFTFVGDPSLAVPSFDTCITGKPQPGVFEGWQFLVAPPSPGIHTIAVLNKLSGRTRTTKLVVQPEADAD